MDGTMIDILQLRAQAEMAGLLPVTVEVGPESGISGCMYAGMRVVHRAEPGAAVLALPARKIGRYEVVVPQRFESAA